MANQLSQLLQHWYPLRDSSEWVLGTVYKTEGPCYRKAGAMMLFNGMGQQFGLLSGGCLESDIQQHARRVMQSGGSVTLCYDASDEDDLSFQLGIGCGGTVYILLQPILEHNNYLDLVQIRQSLKQRSGGFYYQLIADETGDVKTRFVPKKRTVAPPLQLDIKTQLVSKQQQGVDQQWLITQIKPDPHLLVIGGGLDARPVISIASELGWETSLCDPRPANARREYFMAANTILRCSGAKLASYANEQSVDAAILMSHNVNIDADSLKVLQQTSIQYMGLLGPASRRKKVLKAAQMNEADLKIALSGPAGLLIGGELPESIALSILSECHAKLMQRQGFSLSTGLAA